MFPSHPCPTRQAAFLSITPQLLCSQDFARNPFRFIDLAHTLSIRLNRFIDLRVIASFFQEQFHAHSRTQTSQRPPLHSHQSHWTAMRLARLARRVLLLFPHPRHFAPPGRTRACVPTQILNSPRPNNESERLTPASYMQS